VVVSALEGHRIWASQYDGSLNPLLALEERVLGTLKGRTCVDVGCGTGRWTSRLAGFGVDLCEEMLREGSEKSALRGRLLQADAGALPFASGSSDLTLCSFAVGYMNNLPAAIAEIARITRPGGRVIITDLHPAAVAAGWTRSFRVGAAVYEMEHTRTAVPQTVEAARRCGLELAQQQDACFGEPERPIFEAARKSLEDVAQTPAVWIGIWTKP